MANVLVAYAPKNGSTDDEIAGYGFVDWFTLQHYDRFGGRYVPSLVEVDVDVPFSGSL